MTMKIPFVAACALLLAACASGLDRMGGEDPSRQYIDYAGEPIERFNSFRIQGWTPVSRTQLVLWTGVNEAYLLTVWDTCPDLMFATRIGVTSTTSSVSRFEKVLVGRDRCPIRGIQPIDVKQMKEDRRLEREAAQSAPDQPPAE